MSVIFLFQFVAVTSLFWYIQYYSDLLQYKSLEELKTALISILTNSFNHFIKPVGFAVEFLKAFEYFVH